MKPSDKDSDNFELPDGTEVSLWASSDTRESPWSFLWAEFLAPKPRKTWYRVFLVGKPPGDWLPMEPADAVFRQTGFDDDPDVLADTDPGGAQLGAAQKLPRGRYVFQAKVRAKGRDVELGGVTFSVR